jgi:predicted DNA-binding transcriptional regulator YafY
MLVRHSERLVKLIEFLQTHTKTDPVALARAFGISQRTLQRDLDALAAAGFPVYFDQGYRLAAPALLPAIALTVDEALALRVAAHSTAPRAERATARALTLATEKLQQALATRPAEGPPDRQLALALPVQDSRMEALLTTLTAAIAERRSVKLGYHPVARRPSRPRPADPYRLLPSPIGWDLLAYCHHRRRILRIPLAHLREASLMRRRYRPVSARLLERHLHREPTGPAGLHWVRVACRPPLAQALRKHPPAGALTWEDGPEGGIIFTLGALRLHDLLPWLLACGDAIEVLEPAALRQEMHRIAQAVTARHGATRISGDAKGSTRSQTDLQPLDTTPRAS